jgi:hypothetical protein
MLKFWKKFRAFMALRDKKINILTLVFVRKKKFGTKQKTLTPPFKLNGRSLRKEFLTQIENLYTKLMGNNHIQNLEICFIFFMSYATCCPFHSNVISTEESGLNIAA